MNGTATLDDGKQRAAGDVCTPFGRCELRLDGRDESLHTLDKSVELRTTWMNLDL